MRRFVFLLAVAASVLAAPLQAVEWVRAGLSTNQPVWGVRGRLLWAIPPGGFPAPGGPRGLIRLGYPNLTNGGYQLINFIAIEPIVKGNRGFSELESSQFDHTQGKRLWSSGSTTNASASGEHPLMPGRLFQPAPGIEQLDVPISVERFDNGAHVKLVVSQRSDTPDEIELAVNTEPDSAPLDYCILTATMGNKARTRQLWLKDGIVNSRELYPGHRTADFTPHHLYALDRLARTPQQDVLVAVSTDEENPATVFPFPGTSWWHYDGYKLVQYWKKPHGTFREDLQVAVNGRYTYWQSRQPIPGGVAFENFELRERFYEGQMFVFGLAPKTPAELGLPRAKPFTVVCLGDSITHAGYPAELEKILSVQVINAGVSGNTSRQGLARLEKDVLRHRPDVVIVCFGANDSRLDAPKIHVPLKEYEQNLAGIIDRCEKTGAKVLLGTLPPIDPEPYYQRHPKGLYTAVGGLEALVATYREAALRVAAARKVPVVDLNQMLTQEPAWRKPDGVHPTEAGNRIIARLFANEVEALLKKR